ncbi:MAG: DNA translocase FtsK [Candidatus Omnitrophica bacterium]|nr:DNA translocase FtsK [Candidatus Omnitrophota bacterium]
MIPREWTGRVWSLVLAAAGIFVALCLTTYSPADVGWLSSSPQRPSANLGGAVGAWIGFLGRGGFGWASLLVPLLCFLWAWRIWQSRPIELHATSFVIAVVCLVASAGTLLALQDASDTARTAWGGVAGFLLARAGSYYLGTVGAILTALCAGLLSWLIVSGQTLRAVGQGFVAVLKAIQTALGRRAKPAPAGEAKSVAASRTPGAVPSPTDAGGPAPPSPRVRIRPAVEPRPKKLPVPAVRPAPGGFQLPSLELLVSPPPISERQLAEDLQVNAKVLVETLREFGIEASVANIDRGPTVTRYELTPAPGVKLTKIVSLADDLALVLKAASCHVVAPIPGKGRVGIDVPNTTTTIVYLKEILATPDFQQHASVLALPIGKDVSGQAILTDLRDCPHLLIAGATGSGKTVSLNSLLVGILSRASPEQVQFLMIDPKMVELALFNDIPHLAAPVVTNAKKASAALHWAVQEMERRYQLLAKAGVRNIDAYNARAAEGAPAPATSAAEGEAEPEDGGRPLPYLVIVIDELADLMMVASQDVEGAITRLAQLSRAVGLHMILATQRPSVDVITGVIKANFPARIAFQVASKVDSRTILDMNGADKLLGRGDLLFLRPGTAKPIRAQGAFVTDAEIERVTSVLKQQRQPAYNEQLMEHQRQPEAALLTEKDELYETAKQLVLDTGQASTSLLQRRLRLGYGRAARILDLMEQEGLIGPPQGSRPRDILVSRHTA